MCKSAKGSCNLHTCDPLVLDQLNAEKMSDHAGLSEGADTDNMNMRSAWLPLFMNA